jgi:hypothetical protein
MSYSPRLIVHICGEALGLLSGTAAMTFRKGSARHVLAGRIFVASMLTMPSLQCTLPLSGINQATSAAGFSLFIWSERHG